MKFTHCFKSISHHLAMLIWWILIVVQLLVTCLSGGPPYLLGLITDGKSSSTKHRSLTPPSRHVKDQQREHKRAHPVITLPWLSVNEINKEPVTFQENRQRSSSSTETWKPVSLVALSRAFAAAGFAFAGSPRALWQLAVDSWAELTAKLASTALAC